MPFRHLAWCLVVCVVCETGAAEEASVPSSTAAPAIDEVAPVLPSRLPTAQLAPGWFLAVEGSLVNVRQSGSHDEYVDGGWTVSPQASLAYQLESGRRWEAVYRYVTG